MTREEILQVIKEAKESNETSLDLSGRNLTQLPPEIGELAHLYELNLRDNQLTELPKEIAQLANLYELNLSRNNLTELPKEIIQLTNLRTLDLDDNKLGRLPNEITQLKYLQLLNVRRNNLSELPKGIVLMTGLEVLALYENELTQLPEEIFLLANLKSLYLDRNQFSELPTVITKLSNLANLSFSENRFTELPKEITQLTKLESLYIDENQLKKSAEIIISLKTPYIYISEGKSHNPIPREIIERSKNGKELIDYYFQIVKGGGRELNEAKVLVVGQGSVGKTSLIKRLITGEYNPKENKTEGIDINKWMVRVNKRNVQLNVWDFGGQEIMHATHQFFLTKRSLYLLVLDSRLDKDENRVDYWLEKIKSFGGDSPVIVVGNKTDQHPLDINQGGLRKKYPNIKAFYETSCETGKNVDKLREGLIEEIGKLGGIHDVLPASWFEIKEELEKIDRNFIPYDDYLKICEAKEVEDENNQSRLIRLLHDLGIVLNFSDDERMQDTNVLNPEWVTQGVYKILNSRELFRTKGELTKNMLGQILDTGEYPKRKHLFIVDMMRKFELCFDIVKDEKFLVPDLLAEEELDTGDWANSLKFEYHYKVFFNSIITRFIVKMHEYISRTTYWRTGVVLAYTIGDEIKNRALIKADSADRKIFICVDGNKDTRREFLSRIRLTFEQIHGTFAREFVEDNIAEKVSIPNNPEIVVDYKQLLRLENAKIEFIIPEGLVEQFRVKDLLKGLESKERTEISKTKNRDEYAEINEGRKKVFIVHGHDEVNKLKIARFVDQLGLEGIILNEQAGGGKTIIEKLEEYSNVSFAIVLLTPDDVGGVARKPENITPRARQNVILELGFMISKLGRKNVCLLNKGVEIPSDFYGVEYIELDDNEAWKINLAKEMKKAGLDVDMNKLY